MFFHNHHIGLPVQIHSYNVDRYLRHTDQAGIAWLRDRMVPSILGAQYGLPCLGSQESITLPRHVPPYVYD